MKSKNVYVYLILIAILKVGVVFSEENVVREYLKAWDYIEEGNSEEALSLVKKYHMKNGQYRGSWVVLLSVIQLKDNQYEKALYNIKIIRTKLTEKYYRVKESDTLLTDDEVKMTNFFYETLLKTSSLANFKLKNWTDALSDYLELSKEFKLSKYSTIAICYYNINQYSESLKYFKIAYKLEKKNECKDELAYNIGALYAILGDVEASISWLKNPLDHNKLWVKDIKEDKDFNKIRNNIKFKDFMENRMLDVHK